MKRKEREHLKEDPFQIFIQNVLATLRKYKKDILMGVSLAGIVIVIILAIALFRAGSVAGENRLFMEAATIQESDTLTLDQKIEKLQQLDHKKGISASIQLSLASLYFQAGDLKKAQEVLDNFSGSKYALINDKKKILDADILAASGKGKEALDILYKLYSDPKAEVAQDYLLLKMAQIQAKAAQNDTAIANLKKIGDDFPQSPYRRDAQQLLTQLENN